MPRRTHAAAALLCALAFVLALPLSIAVHAAEAVVTPQPATAVIIPYGDWIVAALDVVNKTLVPLLCAAIVWAIRTYVPVFGAFVSQALVQRIVQNAIDYGTNKLEGIVKGQQLSPDLGSQLIATSVQRGVDVLPSRLMALVGGPRGLAEKVFRTLHLDPSATAANTLAPAMSLIPVK